MTHRVLHVPLALLAIAVGLAATLAGGATAMAAEAPVGLGTAGNFSILGGSTVTNTGPTVVNAGDLGLSPGSSVTGFPPGVVNGAFHVADADALQAQSDLTIAYNDAAGRAPFSTVSADLGGQTLVSGVYTSVSSMGLTGTVTLDAQGNPDAVFVFQAGSTLTTESSSVVSLINGAAPCNVFWQVGSSATLGTDSTFRGIVMALTSITATTGATIEGRLLARNGAVTLDSNVITSSTCIAVPPPPETTTTGAPATTETPTTLALETTTVPGGTTTFLARTGTPMAIPAAMVGGLALVVGAMMLRTARRHAQS